MPCDPSTTSVKRYLPLLFSLMLFAPYLYCVVRCRDYWPYSWYDTFSDVKKLKNARIFRIKIETLDGRQHWWECPHEKEIKFFSDDFNRAVRKGRNREKHIQNAWRLICLFEPRSQIKAVHIILRTAEREGDGFRFQDEIFQSLTREELDAL